MAALTPVWTLRLDLSTRVMSAKKLPAAPTAFDPLANYSTYREIHSLSIGMIWSAPLESRVDVGATTRAAALCAQHGNLTCAFIRMIVRRPVKE